MWEYPSTILRSEQMDLSCAAGLVNDKAFLIGALVGMLLMTVLWTHQIYMRTQYLIEKGKAEFRTPTKFGDKFYYIVPETEYVQSELVKLCRTTPFGRKGVPELDQYRAAVEKDYGEKKQKD